MRTFVALDYGENLVARPVGDKPAAIKEQDLDFDFDAAESGNGSGVEFDVGTVQPVELRGDGTGDLITAKERLPIRWWYDGRSVCMRAGKDSVAGVLVESFQVAIGMRPDHTVRMYVVSINDSRFEYISLGRGRKEPEPGATTSAMIRRPK